jgi:hypothetical protein
MGFCKTVCMLTLVACTCSLLSADGEKSRSLPAGVLSALAADETEYCSQFLRKDCHQTFRANLLWRELVITPLGRTAVLVEMLCYSMVSRPSKMFFPLACIVLIFCIAGLLSLCFEHVHHWELNASRGRPAFSHLINANRKNGFQKRRCVVTTFPEES